MLIHIQRGSLSLSSQHSSQSFYLPRRGCRNHSYILMATALEHGAIVLIGSLRPGVLCKISPGEVTLAFASVWLVQERLLPACWNLIWATHDKYYFCPLDFPKPWLSKPFSHCYPQSGLPAFRLVDLPYVACSRFKGTACGQGSLGIPLLHGFRIIILIHPPALV